MSFYWVLWASPTVLPGGEGGFPPQCWGCVALRLCCCPSRFPPFPLRDRCAFVVWDGPFGCFLFVGGWDFPASLLCWCFFGKEGFCSSVCSR